MESPSLRVGSWYSARNPCSEDNTRLAEGLSCCWQDLNVGLPDACIPESFGRSNRMPKVIPVPDELSKPFWDAVNARRLVLQHCGACEKLQYPPQKTCQVCASDAKL